MKLLAVFVSIVLLLLLTSISQNSFAWDAKNFKKPTAAELKKKLSPMQYEVTQEEGTEPAFHNDYWNQHEPGIYVDVVSGEPLFSSLDKYDSGTGWPSFTKTIQDGVVTLKSDHQLLSERTEVKSKAAGSHLGHVFDDGPPPTGKRFCMDSAALRFIPASQLKAQGYGEYEKLFSPSEQTAVLAGGCFWGMEEIFRKVPGVLQTRVGYTGGHRSNPKYDDVKTGKTGHAESIEIKFDPAKISYSQLLEYFFKMHDPTSLNRQGNDIGTQYRSEIFYMNDGQKKSAEQVIAKVNKSKKWKKDVVTQIAPASSFYPAEDYHQKYLVKNPGGYNDHFVRDIDFDR